MNNLRLFEQLATTTGIALPGLLQKLISSGKTAYHDNWANNWRELCLSNPPALISCYDFEWVDANKSQEIINDWLNSAFQNGRTFLPFAQTGAGDAYCLTAIDAHSIGIALVYHDDDTSQIGYPSFDDFVYCQLLETLADFNHLTDHFSDEEAWNILKTDVLFMSNLMNDNQANFLQSLLKTTPTYREVNYGAKAATVNVLSALSQTQLTAALLTIAKPQTLPICIVAEWEISQPDNTSSTDEAIHIVHTNKNQNKTLDWQVAALNPTTKFAAIKAYQQAFGVELSVAKTAVDNFILARNKNS